MNLPFDSIAFAEREVLNAAKWASRAQTDGDYHKAMDRLHQAVDALQEREHSARNARRRSTRPSKAKASHKHLG